MALPRVPAPAVHALSSLQEHWCPSTLPHVHPSIHLSIPSPSATHIYFSFLPPFLPTFLCIRIYIFLPLSTFIYPSISFSLKITQQTNFSLAVR